MLTAYGLLLELGIHFCRTSSGSGQESLDNVRGSEGRPNQRVRDVRDTPCRANKSWQYMRQPIASSFLQFSIENLARPFLGFLPSFFRS